MSIIYISGITRYLLLFDACNELKIDILFPSLTEETKMQWESSLLKTINYQSLCVVKYWGEMNGISNTFCGNRDEGTTLEV